MPKHTAHILYRIFGKHAYPSALTPAERGEEVCLRFSPHTEGTLRIGRTLLPLKNSEVRLRTDLLNEGENRPLLFLAGRTVTLVPFTLQGGRLSLSDDLLSLGETLSELDCRLRTAEATLTSLSAKVGKETIL